MNYIYRYESPLGNITLESNGEALCGLWLEGQKTFGAARSSEYEKKELTVFDDTVRWLDIYFRGQIPDFTPPLLLNTTPFRREVCEIMLSIPYGQTVTYGMIADRIAARRGIPKMSAKAVGGAVGHNPISIIIPCHRVVGAGGDLTGYAGGIDKKIKLLTIEKADMSGFFIPGKGKKYDI